MLADVAQMRACVAAALLDFRANCLHGSCSHGAVNPVNPRVSFRFPSETSPTVSVARHN
jgi:hypothetical protein